MIVAQPGARPRRRGDELLSQSVRFPAGRPLGHGARSTASGSRPRRAGGDGTARLTRDQPPAGLRGAGPRTRVRPDDDAFSVEPGGTRTVTLEALDGGGPLGEAWLTALNLVGRVVVRTAGP